MIMRGGRLEKFVLLPFSIRCDSDSSVALATTPTGRNKGGEEKSKMDIKNQTFTKASFSEGIHRLIRRFKTLSQIFVHKEEMEETEKEMEIGFPTDVKHVTHIGLDGSSSHHQVINNPNLEINLSFPPNSNISFHQFELAMSAQSRPSLSTLN